MNDMALRPQLVMIATHGWRLRVDTQRLSELLYMRDTFELSDEQANEFLMFLVEQDEETLHNSIYDWAEDDDDLGN